MSRWATEKTHCQSNWCVFTARRGYRVRDNQTMYASSGKHILFGLWVYHHNWWLFRNDCLNIRNDVHSVLEHLAPMWSARLQSGNAEHIKVLMALLLNSDDGKITSHRDEHVGLQRCEWTRKMRIQAVNLAVIFLLDIQHSARRNSKELLVDRMFV